MKTITRIAVVGILATGLSLGAVALGHAQDTPGLSASGSIGDALGKLGAGREVELVLTNGKTYRGKLGTLGKDTVLVTQIAGKEFYDVLIALDEVAAVEIRARGN